MFTKHINARCSGAPFRADGFSVLERLCVAVCCHLEGSEDVCFILICCRPR